MLTVIGFLTTACSTRNLCRSAIIATPASAGGSSVYSYSLTRDVSGRITGKIEVVQGATDSYAYGYDDAGRLATVTKNGQQT